MVLGRNIALRDNYIVASLGAYTEDAFGTNSSTPASTIEFWASVEDMKSDQFVDQEGRRRDKQAIKLLCDARDAADITIEHKITIDGSSKRYQVVDYFESEFKYETCIMIKSID